MFDLSVHVRGSDGRSQEHRPTVMAQTGPMQPVAMPPGSAREPGGWLQHALQRVGLGRRAQPVSLVVTLKAGPGEELPIPLLLEHLCRDVPEVVPLFPGEGAEGPNRDTRVSLPEQNPAPLLLDRRGRPTESFKTDDTGENRLSPIDEPEARLLQQLHEEELFFSRGSLRIIEDESPGEQFTDTPFVVRLHTKFESFRDGSHILHQLIQTQSPVLDEIAPALSARFLSRLVPAQLETVRLGIESYAPRRASGLLGFAPTVTDRMYIEMSRTVLRITTDFEVADHSRGAASPGEKADEARPADWHVLERIDGVLRRTDIFPNLLQSIEETLGAAGA